MYVMENKHKKESAFKRREIVLWEPQVHVYEVYSFPQYHFSKKLQFLFTEWVNA